MSSKDNVLFSDIFDIKDVDGAGKKFDKGKEKQQTQAISGRELAGQCRLHGMEEGERRKDNISAKEKK
jgi:hypothetical protein